MSSSQQISSHHLHIEGLVQGVGFRPLVYRLAREMGLEGWVINGPDGVHIEINAVPEALEHFCQRLQAELPDIARITSFQIEPIAFHAFEGFEIRESKATGVRRLLLPSDLDLCPTCQEELFDPGNRRFAYPFITCTQCGPRFSIIERLPYDRPLTSMRPFEMCEACAREYNDPLDRRHFSQTNSCRTCGIALWLEDGSGKKLASEQEALVMARQALEQGKILAVKGIGGYLLMLDARNAEVVHKLRDRKQRPSKPFALMYPDQNILQLDLELSPEAAKAMQSRVKPIVLLPLRPQPQTLSPQALRAIAPGLDRLGVMLPYTPLFALLLQDMPGPMVATSGNLSGSPILYQDELAREGLQPLADLFLVNDREIVIPQDDSVLQLSARHQQPIWLRRSRGLAPTYAGPKPRLGQASLAMGAQMKAAFGLWHEGNVYLSQYLGELSSYDTQLAFQHSLRHFLSVMDARPQQLIIDLHPDYFASRWGRKLALEWEVPLKEVQHHEAHFAAVLAENDWLQSPEPVLGIIWDGLGWGKDNQIWGGECFRYAEGKIERLDHLAYYPHLAGDKMSREPRLATLAMGHAEPAVADLLKPRFSELEWRVYQQLLAKPARLQSASLGRLFDAVACLLDLGEVISYEGEAAMRLEQLARRSEGAALPQLSAWQQETFSAPHLLRQVAELRQQGISREAIALAFHQALVEVVAHWAQQFDCRRLAFSGGVWQNSLLVDLVIDRLGASHELGFHRELSPNDEGIALGQLVLGEAEE